MQKNIKEIKNFKPDFIFHLAAEAIVKRAFKNPKKLGNKHNWHNKYIELY